MKMRINQILLSLAFLVLLLSPLASLAQENLIMNPGIDEEGVDWSKGMWYADGSSLLEFAPDASGEGYCLYICNLSENDARFEQVVEVEPGTVYKISCRAKAEGCGPGAPGAGLSLKDSFVSSDTLHDTKGLWEPLELYGMTGSDQTELTLMARVGGYGALNTGSAWFDAFEMVALSDVPEDIFIHDFSSLSSAGSEDEDGEETGAVAGFLEKWSAILVGGLYALVCLAFFAAALRGKLPYVPREQSAGCRRAFWLTAAAALCIRILVALLVRGYEVDMNCFTAWALRMAEQGPGGFYSESLFCDYPPGYLYLLWAAGSLIKVLRLSAESPFTWLILKFFPLLADIFCAWLVYRVARDTLGNWIAALMGGLFALNPVAVVDSAAWGQVDSVLTALLLLSVLLAVRNRYLPAVLVYVLAVLVKPQALLLGPIGLTMMAVEVAAGENKVKNALRLLFAGLAGIALLLLLSLPYISSLPEALLPDGPTPLRPFLWLLGQYGGALDSYNCITVNACNLYEMLGMGWVSLDDLPRVSIFAWVLFGLSYAYSLFLYIRAKDRGKAFLCAAILLALVFAFGPKMHERYLFPVLGFLALAYAIDRDIRLFFAFIFLSFTQLVNISLVLRYGHLIQSGRENLVFLTSLLNVASAAFLAWTGWEMCVAGHVVGITRIYKPASADDAGKKAKRTEALHADLTKPRDARLNLKRRDWLLMLGLTAIYAVVAFFNLGATASPQTSWKAGATGEQITFDLGQNRDFTMTWYGGICSSTFLVEMSEDGQVWSEAHYAQFGQGKMFCWHWYQPSEKDDEGEYCPVSNGFRHRARYVRLTAERAGLSLLEVGFLDELGLVLPIAQVYSSGGNGQSKGDPKALVDEQETVPPRPTCLNGMYFDEIYHGRTAYEMLTGSEHIYENTHPPLGKVLIMLGIKLFGMTPFGWRFMPALFGVLMVPLMYLLGKQLFKRSSLAFLGAFLLAVDCMHFTQSRLATVDVFAVFFIMLMYLFMFRYAMMSFYHSKLVRTLIPLGLCGIAMGLAVACKWIGIYGGIGLAVIFFHTLLRRFLEYRYARGLLSEQESEPDKAARRAVRLFPFSALITLLFCLVFFVAVPLLLYYGSYYWPLGPAGRFNPSAVWAEQGHMLSYHASISWNTHHFESPWYEWPLIVKPMWYYTGSAYLPGDQVSSISCMGNPVVWWGGLVALLWVFARLLTVGRRDRRYQCIAVAFLSGFLPWVLVPRPTYIYHYFTSVPFIILATLALFEWIRSRSLLAYRVTRALYYAGALLLFAGFYPLLSGLPIPRSYAQYLRWFNWLNF